jgi:hypothetical protein
MAGLLQLKNNDQLDAEAAGEDEVAPEQLRTRLVARIHEAWTRNKRAKDDIDEELLRCLRQRRGEYDPDELALIQQSGGGNTIYMMLTETKCAAAAAWIADIMLPADDLPVGAEASPVPELPAPVYAQLVQRVVGQAEQALQQQGAQITAQQLQEAIDRIEADVKQRVNDAARERAEGMTKKLHDTAIEAGLRDALADAIDDFVTYPAAVLKGPSQRKETRIEWGPRWQPVAVTQVKPQVERVSPFDVYPSPGAEDAQDGDFIERLRLSRKQLYDRAGLPGYDDEAIARVLQDHDTGQLTHWLWTESERLALENKPSWWLTHDTMIDALHYWGGVSGADLIEWGMDGAEIDKLDTYEAEAILIGEACVYCVLNDDPEGKRPYHVASYRRIPGAFWGVSIPYLIRNTQKMCNSVARSLADNLAISSGMQAVVNVDALADGEEVTSIYPWKIWQMSFDANAGGAANPVHFFQPTANANELLGVYQQWEIKADDESGIPRYSYGNEHVGGAAATATGLHTLFEAASKGIRQAIAHIDAGIMRPLVRAMYMDEMRYGRDTTIKGDMAIIARGAASLLIRSNADAQRQQFLELTANQVDMGIIGEAGRAEILRGIADGMDLKTDKIVPSREEIAQRQAQRAQKPDPDEQKLQLQAQKQQTDAQLQAHKQALAEQKQQGDAQQAGAKLAEQTQEDERRFRLDVARYLSGEQQKKFRQRRGLSTLE